MSESGDYNPGPWRGHDFKSARAAYDVHVGRSYDEARASNKKRDDVLPKSVKTDSESPLVIACDVTGSMGDWPATIFSKLPYLDHECKEYLGKGMEISFAAIGDANCDHYPLQVRPFCSGTAMKKRLEELIIEGGGGGSSEESYDLAALYYSRNVDMPNAIKPLFIFIGDEGLYNYVNSDQSREWSNVEVKNEKRKMTSLDAIKELQKKFNVYLVRKHYNNSGDSLTGQDKVIHEQWESYLGADHISILPAADRVVDVIFGILAKETGRVDYFNDELKTRQKPHQVVTVLKALESIHAKGPEVPIIGKDKSGKSVMKREKKSEASKALI